MPSNAKAEEFKAQLLAKIPAEWRVNCPKNDINIIKTAGILSPAELSILDNDATSLRDLLAAGDLTAVEVTKAFAKATAIAHQATHCLFDFFPEEALERAQWLDDELKRTGEPVGPLHGVPVSMKDMMALQGHDTNAGFLLFAGKNKAEKDCLLVDILRKAGAVFICKSAQPQGTLSTENESFAGVTVNPYNDRLTSGGSTGGESALLALKASVMGVGSDMAGSLRTPGAACGVLAFKPTAGRLPLWGGNAPAFGGTDLVSGAAGPMAASPWRLDPSMVGMPWNTASPEWRGQADRPRIGILRDNGDVMPHPPMVRALNHAVERLKQAGLELVEIQPFRSKESWEILGSVMFEDGGAQVRKVCEEGGEECLPLTEWLISQCSPEMSMAEYLDLAARRDDFRADYYAHFEQANIDVMLTPGSFSCARPHRTTTYPHYWSIYNLVDVPAAVFPTGLFVDPLKDVKQKRTDFLGKQDEKLYQAYDPDQLQGAPLSLQLVGARWQDEKLMQALEMITSIIHPSI